MKLSILLILFIFLSSINSQAQYKKDGTPDMRYKSNKQTYGTSQTPSNTSNTNTSVRYQNGYTKTDGTYVDPHYKTNTNKTNTDNFSTKDNVNTFTGESGTKAKDYSSDAQNYGRGKTIQTGSKGGQYYINSKGNKTYVPKR